MTSHCVSFSFRVIFCNYTGKKFPLTNQHSNLIPSAIAAIKLFIFGSATNLICSLISAHRSSRLITISTSRVHPFSFLLPFFFFKYTYHPFFRSHSSIENVQLQARTGDIVSGNCRMGQRTCRAYTAKNYCGRRIRAFRFINTKPLRVEKR